MCKSITRLQFWEIIEAICVNVGPGKYKTRMSFHKIGYNLPAFNIQSGSEHYMYMYQFSC